jgi:hypothetical protein
VKMTIPNYLYSFMVLIFVTRCGIIGNLKTECCYNNITVVIVIVIVVVVVVIIIIKL